MDALVKWMLALAVGCFGSGAVIGHIVCQANAHGLEAAAGDVQFVEQLTHTYGLKPRQAERLLLVLQYARDKEYQILASTQHSQLPPEVVAKLSIERARTDQRIRALLDVKQRERYDRDSRPFGSPAGAATGTTDRR